MKNTNYHNVTDAACLPGLVFPRADIGTMKHSTVLMITRARASAYMLVEIIISLCACTLVCAY